MSPSTEHQPTPAGVVEEIWRYPVKSLGGERLARADIDVHGIAGDRRLGIFDERSGKLLSAKTVPRLLEATAAFDGRDIVITGPGFTLSAADSEAAAVLSGWLDREVRLAAPAEGEQAVFELQVDPDDADGVVDLHTPEGSLFDSRSVLHLLTDAALRAAAELHPAGDWDRRRFRPNIVVRAAGDDFAEDAWVGHRVEVGPVATSVRKRTGRCVLTTRPQPGIPRDSSIFRSLVAGREGNLGIYLDVVAGGAVVPGDPVLLR